MSSLPKTVVLNRNKLKIHSPEGYVPFLGINKITKDRYIHLKFNNGKEIKCSEDHPFLTIDGIVRAKNLTKKIEVITENGGCFVISKRNIKRKIDLYDIVNSGKQHLYYSNGIVSHNCHFLGSSNTLISGSKLQMLTYVDPIASHELLDIYEHPVKPDEDKGTVGHTYAITVDVAEGRNLDASAFSIIDITNIPYKQVAKYNSSSIPPLIYPTVIYNAAKYYNDAYVLIEINNTPQVADILHSDLEYENVVKVITGNKKAQQISAGFGRGVQLGVKMSPLVKRIGCSNLKTLIESDRLIIRDFDTISQLTTFVSNHNSFAAEENTNDDIVMTLVIFAWMTTQKYFKDIVTHDIRKNIQREIMNQDDDLAPPMGEMDNGFSAPLIAEGGDLWVETTSSDPYAEYINDFLRR